MSIRRLPILPAGLPQLPSHSRRISPTARRTPPNTASTPAANHTKYPISPSRPANRTHQAAITYLWGEATGSCFSGGWIMSSWDPGQYLRFADERTRPAIDLAARVEVADPGRVVDLGCGPGNSTAVLRKRWPKAEVTGVDSSPEMIAAAKKSEPTGRWVLGDIATWAEEKPFDVVFSNAALQWVPDHAAVVPRLFGLVAPGGALAVQMPAHFDSPLHQLIDEIADRPEWRSRTAAAKKTLRVEHPSFYYEALAPHADRVELWLTEYIHVMRGPPAILEWIRGTGLRPFLAALADDKERAEFERLLVSGLSRSYLPQADSRVLFPYRRLFLVAYRKG